MNLWKILGDAFTKLLISQLRSVQECRTWLNINAKTCHAHKMVQYASNLNHIVKNIDENMRNSRILKENKGGIPTKLFFPLLHVIVIK